MKRLHCVIGVVLSPGLSVAVGGALAGIDLAAVQLTQELDPDEAPVLGSHAVKRLEFDGVIVVNPYKIHGARRTFALRGDDCAVRRLAFIYDASAIETLMLWRATRVVGCTGRIGRGPNR